MKTCKSCNETKGVDEFYRNRSMADGRVNQCRDCVKAQVRANRLENIESIRAYDSMRYRTHPHRTKEARRQASIERLRPLLLDIPAHLRLAPAPGYAKEDAIHAREAVAWAVKSDRLARQPCVACGAKRVHAHHFDYGRPLDVIWLCIPHHQAIHHALGGQPEMKKTA